MNGRTRTLLLRWTQAAVGVLLLCALLGGSGCSRRKPGLPPGLSGQVVAAPLQPIMDRMHYDGQRNWVLHLNTLAVEALRLGDRQLAKRALDESIIEINAVFGDSAEARRARSIFFNEESKLFKGEAYERCMTFFYRGILYMQDGEWDNARACFRSAIFNDEFAEEDSKRADWVTFHWLKAICEDRLRTGYMEQDYRVAMQLLAENSAAGQGLPGSLQLGPTFVPERPAPEHNLLVVVLTGSSPQKALVGTYSESIQFRQGRPGGFATLQLDGSPDVPGAFLDSIFYQAATRGGRPVDRLNRRKASYKGGAQAVGDVAIMGGYMVALGSDNSNTAAAGLALVGVGLVSAGVAALISPRADDRAWLNIADKIYAWTGTVTEGPRHLRVTESTGRSVESTITVPASGTGLQVVLVQFDPAPSMVTAP